MRHLQRVSTIATLAALILVPVAWAADPSEGTVSHKEDAAWTGGPFFLSDPVACTSSSDPVCDHFFLSVDAREGTHVGVGITTEDPDANDLDLFVYAPDGTLLASSTTPTGTESLVFEHSLAHGEGAYEVRVQPWLVEPGTVYEGVAMVSRDPVDRERECLEPVPEAVSVDFTENIGLETMVLLDGVSRDRGEELMTLAASSYAPFNVTLDWDFRKVSFDTDDADGLIQAAKDKFRGERPKGFDVVYVLTSKDIQLGGDTGVAGLADCIGGVRYPDRAFAVGEDFGPEEDDGRQLGPFVHTVDGSAIVAAHEIGHLMGNHHHYANCVEGTSLEDTQNLELTPCTLMFNFVNFASLPFSTLNTTVARGHAEEYARP